MTTEYEDRLKAVRVALAALVAARERGSWFIIGDLQDIRAHLDDRLDMLHAAMHDELLGTMRQVSTRRPR